MSRNPAGRNQFPVSYDAPTLLDRLFRHRYIDPATGCWLWTGSKQSGYGNLWTTHKGKRRSVRVHRLIAWIYLGYKGTDNPICHRCNVRACFNPAHLYVGTQSQNILDAIAVGAMWYHKGEDHYEAKLTERDVRDVRRMKASGITYAELAKQYGVHTSTLKDLVRRRTWKHVTDEVIQ